MNYINEIYICNFFYPLHQQTYLGCSNSSSLARVEERLQWLVNDYNTTNSQSAKQQYLSLLLNSKIPIHTSWTVKMWHFGQDALTSYSGEKFEITWADSLNLFRYYAKDYGKKKTKVRREVQEYPKKPLGMH